MFIQPLFPTPLGFYEIDPAKADLIEQKVVDRLDLMEFQENGTFTDYYQEHKLFDIEEELPELWQFMFQCRDHFYEETSYVASDEVQYWFQDYRTPYSVHQLHHHGMYGISGVYWVRANEDAGLFRMVNPNPFCEYADVASRFNTFAMDNATLPPKKGLLILFPTYLKHEVLPGGRNIKRTTIAFNFGKVETTVKNATNK